MQKEHVVCWFARKYYLDGSTDECIRENGTICKKCYFNSNNSKPNCKPQVIDAEKVFSGMKRPEMYFWIAEVLDLIDEDELKKCITEVKVHMQKKSRGWKIIINKYITWNTIEKKLMRLDMGK